jgi:hypothetical protein
MPARAYGRSNAQGDRTSAQNFSVSPKKPGGIMQRRPRACGHMIEGETTADHPISVPRPEETR